MKALYDNTYIEITVYTVILLFASQDVFKSETSRRTKHRSSNLSRKHDLLPVIIISLTILNIIAS